MAFQPGQSGNPAGRVKKLQTFAGLLRKKTALAHLFVNETEDKWPEIIKCLFDLARKGDLKAIGLILDHSLIRIPQNPDSLKDVSDSEPMSMNDITEDIKRKMEEYRELIDSFKQQEEEKNKTKKIKGAK